MERIRKIAIIAFTVALLSATPFLARRGRGGGFRGGGMRGRFRGGRTFRGGFRGHRGIRHGYRRRPYRRHGYWRRPYRRYGYYGYRGWPYWRSYWPLWWRYGWYGRPYYRYRNYCDDDPCLKYTDRERIIIKKETPKKERVGASIANDTNKKEKLKSFENKKETKEKTTEKK